MQLSALVHSEELWEFLGVVPAEVKVEKFVTWYLTTTKPQLSQPPSLLIAAVCPVSMLSHKIPKNISQILQSFQRWHIRSRFLLSRSNVQDPESWPLITSKESVGALVKLCQSVWVKSDAVMSPNITVCQFRSLSVAPVTIFRQIQEPLCRTMVNLCVEPANRQGLIEAGCVVCS